MACCSKAHRADIQLNKMDLTNHLSSYPFIYPLT